MDKLRTVITALLLSLLAATQPARADGFLQIRNGYFWDPAAGAYFIPRGVAYQVWNPPVGANQSFGQLDYDLVEFTKMRANSVRAELDWSQVETNLNQYDWSKADYLVAEAERLGLRLFLIIGYQYPPAWLPAAYRGIDNEGLRADVVACLAGSSPSNALSCLHPLTASILQSNTSPATLAQVLNCLVAGAQAGGVSNILNLLQTTLAPEDLDAILPYLVSNVINYEDPRARAAYQQYIAAVTARYQNSTAIGGWILGNEYAYFDLWEDLTLYPVHRFLGYDPLGRKSFQGFLQALYQTNIAALNTNWQANYADFSAVPMPLEYPPDRHLPGYQDLIQWRKQSIGSFVALGAQAARQADPNHLCTYSMVGGIFSGDDANYTCEDARTIVTCCAAAGAPLDFWSLNNYGWALLGSEMRSAAFGVEKYQTESGLPIMISETGYSSTEDLFDYDKATGYSYSGARQPKALPSTLWEAFLCGAIGVHFFTWNDRTLFTQGYFYRERGFGIVQINRLPKPKVYDNMVAMFRQMDNIRLEQLLGGSTNPPPEVQLFWSTNADMVWPRADQENAMLWGVLKRAGFQLRILDDGAFSQGAYADAPALLLSRCYQMDPGDLEQLASDVAPAGILVHAEADLPGQFDAYGRTNANWAATMRTLFGIDVSKANDALDVCATNDCYSPIHVRGVATLGSIAPGFTADMQTWKLWQNILPVSATEVLTAYGNTGQVGCSPYCACQYRNTSPSAALLIHSPGPGLAKTAVNPFAVGDTFNCSGSEASQWDTRSTVLGAIYRDAFGLTPKIELSGPGAAHVLPSYRICANGSVLISLLNEDTNAASLTIYAPQLLIGRKVEDLSVGGLLTSNSDGTLSYTNQGDDCVVLYAYSSAGGQDNSLINANPNKLWFEDAPIAIWPSGSPAQVNIGYDTSDPNLSLVVTLEQTWPHAAIYGQSSVTNIAARGTVLAQVPVPDADPCDADYVSSPEGGQYVFHARLLAGGLAVSDLSLPVRLLFGVHPTQPLPSAPAADHTYAITLAWEELPSSLSGDKYPVPLDRAAQWDSLALGQEHYRIVLELQAGGQTVSSNSVLTSAGTGSNTFLVRIPAGAVGPFTWLAYSETATNVLSHDVEESFEGYALGANWQGPDLPYLTNNLLWPWNGYVYSSPPATSDTSPTNLFLNQGVQLLASDGSQSAFMVVTNPAWVEVGTFGLVYEFTNGTWALPEDRSLWTNYVFSYDFQEASGLACSVEMQVKNLDLLGLGKWLQYTNLYAPGPDGWFTLSASLDQFLPPPGLFGVFDPSSVDQVVVNIRMLATNGLYVGSFDHIRFLGPEADLGGPSQTVAAYDSANGSPGWLSVARIGPEVSVSWVGSGVLQSAPAFAGPWADVTNATNPLVLMAPAAARFYRLRQ